MQTSAVLLTVDCLRADHVGAYGYDRDTTPNIDALAERGTYFEHAYSNGPGTRFAFKSLNGGVFPLRIEGAGLPPRQGATLAERLSEAGYRTAAFTNNPFISDYFYYDRGYDVFRDVNHWTDTEDGSEEALNRLNRVASRVSQRLSDGLLYRTLKQAYSKFVEAAEARGVHVGTTDADVVDAAIEWIRDAEADDQPYFTWIHFMGAHHPYRYLEDRRRELGVPDTVDHVRNPTDIVQPGTEPPRSVIDAYDTNIRDVDAQIGRLRDVLADDTTVIVTGDHGEEFGQHDEFHKASVYDTMARVPMIVAGPAADDVATDQPACHVDVPPTLVAGADADPPTGWDGVRLTATDHGRDTLYLGFETLEGVTGGVVDYPWKYVCEMPDGETVAIEELYDTAADPSETNDQSARDTDRLERLRRDWQDHYEQVRVTRLRAARDLWDAEKDLTETVVEGESTRDERELDEQLEYLGYK